MRAMRIVVVGAGVIGRIFAARLCLAGHRVTLIARGTVASELAASGVTIALDGSASVTAFPVILTDAGDAEHADLAFIAIRRDQVDAIGPAMERLAADTVVSLIDLPLGLDELARLVGPRRFVPAFPGVGGTISPDGCVKFVDVTQQPTTIQLGPASAEVSAALQSAGFRTAIVPNMTAWLQCHAVFVCAFESAIVAVDGDLAALCADRTAMRNLMTAVREGLVSLASRGIEVSPAALATIFVRMPVWFASWYWRRQLGGPLGRLGFLPHSMASRRSELPALQDDVRVLTHGSATPCLDRLFDASR